MKLKGKTVKRLKKEQKSKMKETLEKMENVREEDNLWLRDLIKGKLDWAKSEIKKGEERLRNIRTQINRLEGIVIFINDILETKKEEQEEKKEK
jgi:hypothetical protein